ncbi:MAG: EVE domain-containing protein [Dehalococcoidia bacterium]
MENESSLNLPARQHWLICTTEENFQCDRRNNFSIEGFKNRIRNTVNEVKIGDRFVLYINQLLRFGAIIEATGKPYFDDKHKVWVDDEIWPCRFETKALLALDNDELLDVKKLVPDLSFITPEQKRTNWGLAFHQSLRKIPSEDFELIESEMRKISSLKGKRIAQPVISEEKAKEAIMSLQLEKRSLHDRIGEMLEQIGSRMDYNAFTNFKVTPEHAVLLDVAWLNKKSPEIAIEIQIGGNITEAKDKLAQARKFNYRKVIMVIEEEQLDRLNAIIKFDDLVDWMEAWSIQAVYRLYTDGMSFLNLYERLRESRYKKKTEVEFVK